MLSLDNFIDKPLFIALRDVGSLGSIGLDQDNLIVTLRGYEVRQGIWVEVSSLRSCPVKCEGNSLDDVPAVVFIPWYHIVSLVHFPGRETLEIPAARSKKIGFRQE